MTGPLSDQRLAEIEATIPAIAPGPWRLERGNALGEWVVWSGADDPILQVLVFGSDLGPFLETVREAVPALIAETRRLRGENEQLSDLDAAASRRSELQAERDRAVTRWHEEHKRAETAEAERDELRARIAAARSEIARQDTAATLAMRPGYCDVSDALAAVDTHLVDPERRPATPDSGPAWPHERACAPDGSLRMVRPAIPETSDGAEP